MRQGNGQWNRKAEETKHLAFLSRGKIDANGLIIYTILWLNQDSKRKLRYEILYRHFLTC